MDPGFRQAFAGMIWSKEFYYFDIHEWLNGDPAQVPPPARAPDAVDCDAQHRPDQDGVIQRVHENTRSSAVRSATQITNATTTKM